ncbi:SLC13 family permease [Pelagibaculum spongiae]|uniref:Dihydroorotate dehydrogenase n=1 Tax=Pelagibaculum spongiae TaxID=2080658 RepID=A0A2V1GYK4_9GAMM|nr:SLC13 family permease [Pelagibaculum spongiae]PVZ72171.1 dihydroorotate dehydrogenase [Pelagibaculum spongiae]
MKSKISTLVIIFAIYLVTIFIPLDMIPLDGLTPVQQHILGLFLLATLLWVTEPVPAYATSLLIITLMIATTSSSAPFFIRNSIEASHLIPYKSVFASFSSPVIILFLGGFFIALSATKYKLDINLARVLLKPFGTKFHIVMLGLMLITAVFSMFMSNTATTLMMLTIVTPLLLHMDKADPGVKAMVLSIPFAANIGGMGTPIGTPPNAIAFRYLTGEHAVSFGHWMMFAIPLAMVMLAVAWLTLRKLYSTKIEHIQVSIDEQFDKSPKAILVYATISTTVIMWITSGFHGVNAYSVALIPVCVFSLTGIIDKNDIKNINWDVLWLVAGGIAMGMALEQTGLAALLVKAIPFDTLSGSMVVLLMAIVSMTMATFMSNTATANLLMPIAVSMAVAIESLGDIGGLKMIAICVGLSASMGMSLPVSTPPNALAHATGLLECKDFLRIGPIVSIIGVILIFGLLSLLISLGVI